MTRSRNSRAGVTLIEVLIAVTLLSLLTVAMAIAIRVAFAAYTKSNTKLMENRRVAGAQRILVQELEGMMPVFAACGGGPGAPGTKVPFFQGEPNVMHMVSTYSLQEAWRGRPQILEMFVIPNDEGPGVRLVVNESVYTGYLGTSETCVGFTTNGDTGAKLPQFRAPAAGTKSFVLADQLESCRFFYQMPTTASAPPTWGANWVGKGWPVAVRIEMIPLAPDPSRLQPITVTAALHIRRDPEKVYTDAY